MTNPLLNARQKVSVSRVLEDDNYKTNAPCHSGWGTLKNLHCSMAIIAEHRSKFAASTETNKQTHSFLIDLFNFIVCIEVYSVDYVAVFTTKQMFLSLKYIYILFYSSICTAQFKKMYVSVGVVSNKRHILINFHSHVINLQTIIKIFFKQVFKCNETIIIFL